MVLNLAGVSLTCPSCCPETGSFQRQSFLRCSRDPAPERGHSGKVTVCRRDSKFEGDPHKAVTHTLIAGLGDELPLAVYAGV